MSATPYRSFVDQVVSAFGLRPRPFDWRRDCLGDLERLFPGYSGNGRGEVFEMFVCIQCGREDWQPFPTHRPANSGRRSCSGRVVRRSQVEAARMEENKRVANACLAIAKAESGGHHA